MPKFHLPECVHFHGYSFSQTSQLITTVPKRHFFALLGLRQYSEKKNLKQTISELCGIAEVTPNFRDLRTWNGHVDFEEQNITAFITYDFERFRSSFFLIKRIFNAVDSFCDAAECVQQIRFCCDCFTILQRSDAKNLVELCQIKLKSAVKLCNEFKNLLSMNEIRLSGLWNCRTITTDIFNVFSYFDNSIETNMTELHEGAVDEILHTCSLAVQFLCIGFLSYNQTHTRAINPFFLDSFLTNIQLLGSLFGEKKFSKINVQLINLTCMENMIQKAVVAFNMSDEQESVSFEHDMLTSFEDFMDT